MNKKATAYTILGCGVIVLHDAKLASDCTRAGYKIHNLFGRTVGIMLFYYDI